jgi:hypothetical protein
LSKLKSAAQKESKTRSEEAGKEAKDMQKGKVINVSVLACVTEKLSVRLSDISLKGIIAEQWRPYDNDVSPFRQ